MAYSHIVRLSLRSRLSDFQCGFKAIRHDRALELLPLVEDDAWFFDTELLVTAERLGVRISETPVEWTDDPSSSVDIVGDGGWTTCEASGASPAGATSGTCERRTRPGEPPARRPAQTNCSPSPASECSAPSATSCSSPSVGVPSVPGWPTPPRWPFARWSTRRCTARWPTGHACTAGRDAGPPFALVVGVLYAVSLAATLVGDRAWRRRIAGHTLAVDAVAAMLGSCAASLLRFSLLRGWAFRPQVAAARPGPARRRRAIPLREPT